MYMTVHTTMNVCIHHDTCARTPNNVQSSYRFKKTLQYTHALYVDACEMCMRDVWAVCAPAVTSLSLVATFASISKHGT